MQCFPSIPCVFYCIRCVCPVSIMCFPLCFLLYSLFPLYSMTCFPVFTVYSPCFPIFPSLCFITVFLMFFMVGWCVMFGLLRRSAIEVRNVNAHSYQNNYLTIFHTPLSMQNAMLPEQLCSCKCITNME